MAKPTITYGHGWLTDCDDKTGWTEKGTPTLTDTSLTVQHGDIFKITGTASASGKDTYWLYDLTDISSDQYTKAIIRWKTSKASNALGAQVTLDFSTDLTDVQHILYPVLTPQFSTSWTTKTATIEAGKTIKRIVFYAISTAACTAESVYFDFALLSEGLFTFPYVDRDGTSGGVDVRLPNSYADLRVPGRVGDITQYLGMESPILTLSGDMDYSGSWGTPDGEYLYRILHESHTDPWQWFTSDVINCKVTPRDFSIGQAAGSKTQRVWELIMKMYSLSSGDETTWTDLQWLGI